MPRSVLFLVVLALAAPAVVALPVPQDDAGTGRDAPDTRDPNFLVAPGVVHDGLRAPPVDADDLYAIVAKGGETLHVTVLGSPLCPVLYDPAGVRWISLGCVGIEGEVKARFALDRAGTWFLSPAQLHAGPYRFSFDLDQPSPTTLPLHAHPRAGADRTCGTGVPVDATSGLGANGLAFAALKTGTRAVIVWETDEETAGSLRYNVSGGRDVVLHEAKAHTTHVFVLDELPREETLCFRDATGAAHALRLANAMFAHDGDAYVINLLVLANEQPDVRPLRKGLDDYAWRLRDATDGHVKSGAIIVLYGDMAHHNSGWATCDVTHMLAPDTPTCNRVVDVIFTADAFPAGAASTQMDGIRDRETAIWMNSYWQAGTVNLGDDVGSVLMHEMGHYAFAGLDLYVGSRCDVHELSLSIMSSDRSLTEMDDEINRCPNEHEISGYVPTWTRMRERFPLVPDREGRIDPGPTTPGDAYVRHEVHRLPQVTDGAVRVDIPHDDAGSGRDAPDTPTPGVLVQLDARYAGTLAARSTDFAPERDVADHFLIDGRPGDRVRMSFTGTNTCAFLVDAEGQRLAGDQCVLTLAGDGATESVVTLPAGAAYVRVDGAGAYTFALHKV